MTSVGRAAAGLIATVLTLAVASAGTACAEGPAASAVPEIADVATALARLRPLAEAGDAEAQKQLGWIHARGVGVLQDHAAAAHWLGLAARQGDAEAQNGYAALLAAGLGVARDGAAALKWYASAAKQGAPEHQFDLGRMYENGEGVARDPAQAARWYALAAAQGLADAEASLGLLHQRGEGVPRDPARAFELLQAAAGKGQARAQNNLALMYVRGEGVAQDYATAAGWFRKAADQGLKQAMTNLGVMYENGFGVPIDEAAAAEWYRRGGRQGTAPDTGFALIDDATDYVYDARLQPPGADGGSLAAHRSAAERGDPVAQFILAYLLAVGLGVDRDPAAAATLFRKSARAGIAPAMTNLGLLHMRGQGVPQDFVLGYGWIMLAAAAGEPGSAELRDAAAARLTEAQINEAQRLAAVLMPAVPRR
ncbi:hypothetical protein DFR52_104402 [Hoeflea marina]|uniref:TPR repeat protein n=1 Tax=Hoeflea marina TaxID=274592 RepID=A0A317PI97_9HYPH|nr:SEL1-like repeat protein [Hoeflea marina]PWV99110.1 hypothetical protein DFR52_104402 [Hoeflea marina]